MSKRLVFDDTPHNLARLHDEIIAALPELAPIERPDGERQARFSLSGRDEHIEIEVPDDLSEAAEAIIAAVIAAHDPTPTPIPTPPDFGQDIPSDFAEKLAETVANLRAYLALPTPTNAQTIAVIKLLCRIALWQIRRSVG